MQVQLEDGKLAILGVQYGQDVPPRFWGVVPEQIRRTTKVKITVQKDEKVLGVLHGIAFCNPCDQFRKFSGRSHAMTRAFQQDQKRTLLGKKDRQTIAKQILSEIFKEQEQLPK